METAKGKTREEIINRLADRIDSFEKYSQPHSRLMAALALHLARRFGLAAADIDAIVEAAMLHDIGLYAMSPSYHPLPRPLAFEARLDLWRHPVIGEQQMAKRDAMRHAQLLVRWHHEWWNGSGYPDMLAFEDIPIGARILRAVELYSALICDRPYREALSEQQAIEALTSSAGVECDPYVVKALLALLDELRAAVEDAEAVRVAEAQANQSERQPARDVEPSPVRELAAEDQPLAHVLAEPEASMTIPASLPDGIDQPSDVAASEMEPHSEAGPDPRAATEQPNAYFQAIDAEPFETHQQQAFEPPSSPFAPEPAVQPAPRDIEPPRSVPRVELLLSKAQSTVQSTDSAHSNAPQWRAWIGSRYNKKTLLGFQASVLRQIEFRSIAIPYLSEARLDLYLKAWGRLIFANDPRAWAGTVARATVEATEPLGEEIIARLLEDVYVPRSRLENPALRRWFGETDSWWLDNLRRNIDRLDDQLMQAQAMMLGLQTGDYALSFNDETRELRRPLTTVFWRLAGRALSAPGAQPHNRSFNQPVEEFIKHARADLLLLSAPSSQMDRGIAEERSEWRETWVKGASADTDRKPSHAMTPQSRQSYLASIERLLRPASHFRTWAIEYQEPGLAGVQELVDLIKEHRPVKATYSKDVTEVAGGLRSYIIVAEKTAAR
ncbi:MAG TPA: HD domain-containing phosphohydrolase [Blastocatellia bacterium]|nr:HD domain-containing phosphohydrolase [Blastocatellia bacterium]